MLVDQVCVREVDLATATESVQLAAQRMNDRNVGTLVIVDELHHPVGIITDRDVVVKVVARGRDAFRSTVGEIMTPGPQTVTGDSTVEDALIAMTAGPFRRVLVTNRSGKLVGLLSLDDILRGLADDFARIRTLLRRETPASLVER
ncbi:MAG: CBS domain-containing protein [Planctomycetales bacterium]|nr:CBS domain-containing protein [Planctomycetales bacterium]